MPAPSPVAASGHHARTATSRANAYFRPGALSAHMRLSARNTLAGEVTNVETDDVAGKVSLELTSGETVTALITRDSTEELEITEGDTVEAVVKATDVMIQTDD